MEKYRIVLTCFDSNCDVPPYADAHEQLFDTRNAAYEMASKMAHEECAGLNGEDGSFLPEDIEGVFEVDDSANNAFEVRWYEKKAEDRIETDSDIEHVTNYNIYPVEFYPGSENSCSYRGFEILANHAHNRYAIEQHDARFTMVHSLNKAFQWVDGFCLKEESRETQHSLMHRKQSIDLLIKKASEQNRAQKTDAEKNKVATREFL